MNTLSDRSIINDRSKPESQLQHVNHESSITEDEYDISDSPNTSATFLVLLAGQDRGREFGIMWPYLPVTNLGRSICMHLWLHNIFKNFPLAAM